MKTVIYSDERSKLNLKEVFTYFDLLKNLAVRDVTIRYKQTWLGILWAVIRPCFNIVVFGAISMLITKNTDAAQNFLNVGGAMLIWTLMTSCISESSNSLLANVNLLTKVYFPKIILPLSSIMVCLIDFTISFTIYIIVFFAFNGLPGPQIFLIPFFVLLVIIFCLGIGLTFASLNVKYRDVNFALPFLIQFLFYASPVFLTTQFYLAHLPPVLQKVFVLNPVVFLLDGFRYCLFGNWVDFDIRYAAISVVFIFTLFFLGIRYFLKFEKSFADHI